MRTLVLRTSLALSLAIPMTAESQRDTVLVSAAHVGAVQRQLAYDVMRQHGPQDLTNLLSHHLFPPELIMQHQQALRITEQQRSIITGEISRLQAAAVQMQWSVADETQKLVEQLQQPTVSEEQALAQVDRLISMEAGVKRAQLAMLIRIRNALTPAQRDKLGELRTGARHH